MKTIHNTLKLKIPSEVKINCKSRIISVKGKRGILRRNFHHLALDINVKNDEVVVEKWFGNKKELAAVRTVVSHLRNMIKGVTYGFRYKMKSVYAHFPINLVVSEKGDNLEIRNFLGEKYTRQVALLPGVKVGNTGVKDEIQLDGNDVELVSKSAALIQQSCKVRGKDIRKFLDGVYVSERGTIESME